MQTDKKKNQCITFARFVMLGLYVFGFVIFILMLWEESIEMNSYVAPKYDKIDITQILSKDTFTEEDYHSLFEQTGLGKVAIDDILEEEDGIPTILRHQNNFFTPIRITCDSIFITTRRETTINEAGKVINAFELAPMKEGYILISMSTHFFGWRHGHAALVVDAENGTTLEAMVVGENSTYQNVEDWRTYPTVIVLKLKEGSEDLMEQIVSFTKEEMYDMRYSMTTGILSKKFQDSGEVTGTQCAHLIWNAFYKFGYDIDYDGGRLVTPKDIANSPLLEIVQVYGVDVNEPWP